MTIKTAIKYRGWFLCYRGNWYGPYLDYDTALKIFRAKHGHGPDNIAYPVYGSAVVKDKKLLKFNREEPPDYAKKNNTRAAGDR